MLPAEIVRQVRRIQLTTGRQVADVLAGAYHSVFRGRGVEFDEVRPYVPGDDVRTIDWNVTARVGAPWVKRFVEERQLTVMLVVDVSASLDFGSAHRSKREAAVELSALVAFSAIHNDDKVGIVLFHHGIDEYIPPRKGSKHALRVVREVLARGNGDAGAGSGARGNGGRGHAGRHDPGGRFAALPRRVGARLAALARARGRGAGEPAARATDLTAALELCLRVLPRRAILFVVSDFIDEGWLGTLSNANRKHDVVAVHVTDERETVFADAGLVTLEDAETGARRLVDTGSPAFREAVRLGAARRAEALARDFRGAGVDLVTIDAARPVIDPLLAFFRMREKRNRR